MHATLYIVSSPPAQEVPEDMEECLWKYTLMDSSPPKTLQLRQIGRGDGSRGKG